MTEDNIERKITDDSRLKNIDFDNLKFGREFSDHIFLAEFSDGRWHSKKIVPYEDMSFSPGSSVFHYGQAIFEGLKAFKSDDGKVLLFRPEENFLRMNISAERMCMPQLPREVFMDGLINLIDLDRDWVPEGKGKSLYIRPFMIADENFLGVRPAEKYKFMIITSPTSTYYEGAVKVKVETKYSRACKGGVGFAKAAANYAASLYPAQQAREQGYDQLVWTDSSTHQYIEEAGTMNIMFVVDGKIITPSIDSDTDSILSGITRKSALQLLREWGEVVEERPVKLNEIIEAHKNGELQEAFGLGTAASVAFISKIGYDRGDMDLLDHKAWRIANRLKNTLDDIKTGRAEDSRNWITEV